MGRGCRADSGNKREVKGGDAGQTLGIKVKGGDAGQTLGKKVKGREVMQGRLWE